MITSLALLVTTAIAAEPVETRWAQVATVYQKAATIERSPDCKRAVVLIQGLRPHPIHSHKVAQAEWVAWQEPGSALVTTLAKESDVFAFAYSQDVSVEEVAESEALAGDIQHLKELEYEEIVLVGYSAGGLVARHFVEDHPDAGVTKVVQICTPNGGSTWGEAEGLVRKPQREFVNSLSKSGRQKCLAARAGKKIPADVDFVCLVGHMNVEVNLLASLERPERTFTIAATASGQGDGVVSTISQWPADLQKQGIPIVLMPACHLEVMHENECVDAIARLVRERQSRWNAEQVTDARRRFLESDARPTGIGLSLSWGTRDK